MTILLIAVCLFLFFFNHQTQTSEKSTKKKIDLGVVDDVTVCDTPPRSQPEPHICLVFDQFFFFLNCTNPEVYNQNTKTMFRFLRMVPKSMRRLLLQQYHLLPQTIPSRVDLALM